MLFDYFIFIVECFDEQLMSEFEIKLVFMLLLPESVCTLYIESLKLSNLVL